MSVPSRASSSRRGALPGTEARDAHLAGELAERGVDRLVEFGRRDRDVELDLADGSARRVVAAGRRRSVDSSSASTGSTVLCIRRIECSGERAPYDRVRDRYDRRVTDRPRRHARRAAGDRSRREPRVLRALRRDAGRAPPHRPGLGNVGGLDQRPDQAVRVVLIEVADRRRSASAACSATSVSASTSRADVDRLCDRARAEGRTVFGPDRFRTARRLLGVHRRSRRPQPRDLVRPGGRAHRRQPHRRRPSHEHRSRRPRRDRHRRGARHRAGATRCDSRRTARGSS